jgi:hypothetical protein
MGMFDELTCEYPLPRIDMQGRAFQTKDFECALWQYKITADGRLVCYPRRLETNPDWIDDPTNNGFSRYFGSMRSVPEPDYEIDFHGDVYFYTHERENPANQMDYGTLITFRARFTEGRVVGIVEVPDGAD